MSRPVITVVISLLVVLTAVLVVLAVGIWRAQPAAATALESADEATADAFMPPSGDDAPTVTPPNATGGPVQGNTPGLFGGSGDDARCDTEQMVRFLAEHPAVAAVWAGGQGIAISDIPGYLRSLTPVVLRADSFVTAHGLRDGRLTSYGAVLQAGTAVLIDGYGTPRVKCYCGNPLSAPPRERPVTFHGRSWERFTPVTVIVIQPAPVVIQQITVINIQNNNWYPIVLPPWWYGMQPGWQLPDRQMPARPPAGAPAPADPPEGSPPEEDPVGVEPGRRLAPGVAPRCPPPDRSDAGTSTDVVTTSVPPPVECDPLADTTTTTTTTSTTTAPEVVPGGEAPEVVPGGEAPEMVPGVVPEVEEPGLAPQVVPESAPAYGF